MLRRRARASRSEDGPVGNPVTVASGSIRSPDEADALSVKLSIWDTKITMRSDGMELGSWPATAVDVRRLNSTAFEFIAEGDRLIFTPDDAAAFGDSPIVGRHGDSNGNRKGRASKKKSDDAEPGLARDPVSADKTRRLRWRTAQESLEEKPSKLSRRDRKVADAKAAGIEAVPVPPSTVPGSIDAAMDDERPVANAESPNGHGQGNSRHEHPVPDPELGVASSKEPREKLSSRAWIRALDVARRYDTFGLDRVPIDEGLRGQEHQHTWDHRVAVSSGLGAHICTLCGAIRRRA